MNSKINNNNTTTWCDDECIDCGELLDQSSAYCLSCNAARALQPIASTSALPPRLAAIPKPLEVEPVPNMIPRTKSQVIRDWAVTVEAGAPSRTTSFVNVITSPTSPQSSTPRARSPRSPRHFSRPTLLRPSQSAASLHVCRAATTDVVIPSAVIATPAPQPSELPICAAGSSVTSSVMASFRSWMPSPSPISPRTPLAQLSANNNSLTTLVEIDALIPKKTMMVDSAESEDEEDEHFHDALSTSTSQSSGSAADLPAMQLGELVSVHAVRHRSSRPRLPVPELRSFSYPQRHIALSTAA